MKNFNPRLGQRQKGEMPIGPILIIALIVIPLVLLLVSGGRFVTGELQEAVTEVEGAEEIETDVN